MGALLLGALGDLVHEEIRGWLDLVPHAILRLAASQLDIGQRSAIYENEWLPELCCVLRDAESRPITRLIRGITFAFGLLLAARRIAREISRDAPALPQLAVPHNSDLVAALRSLPRRQAEVISLHYLGDYTVAETAEILGIAKSTASHHHRRGLERLRQLQHL
jgi:DNA-binding CsgD family transcriptional regulator